MSGGCRFGRWQAGLLCAALGSGYGEHVSAQAVTFHLDLNPPGVRTTLAGGTRFSSPFTDAVDSPALWHWEVEISNSNFVNIGVGVRFLFPNQGSPLEGNLILTAFSSATFEISVEDNPPELDAWRFVGANTTQGNSFDIDTAVTEAAEGGQETPGDYTVQFTDGGYGLGSFTPGSFPVYLVFGLVEHPRINAVTVSNGFVRLGLRGLFPGESNVVQRTSELGARPWMDAGVVVASSVSTNWAEAAAVGETNVLYRVLAAP